MKIRQNAGRVTFPVNLPNGRKICGYEIWFDFKTHLINGMHMLMEQHTEHVLVQEVIFPEPMSTHICGNMLLDMDMKTISADYDASPFTLVWIIDAS